MRVGQARETAQQWVVEVAGRVPGFSGAYTAGSTNWLDDDATMPAASDLDIMVVVTDASLAGGRSKFLHQGVLFEVSYLGSDALRSPELVMGDSQIGPSFRMARIIVDPTGHLTSLLAAVRRDFAKRRWVRARCAGARDRVLRHLRSMGREMSFPDQVIACLFAAGVTTHVLLVAGLRNPTVRVRYVAVRELLADYGRIGFHEALLGLLGSERIGRQQAGRYVVALTGIFAAATRAVDPGFPFAADISDSARPIAIDGSLDLIEHGFPREAMFWIAVTHSRCQKVLSGTAAGDLLRGFEERYRDLTRDLGIGSSADVRRRCGEIERMLPCVEEQAEAILAANRDVEED